MISFHSSPAFSSDESDRSRMFLNSTMHERLVFFQSSSYDCSNSPSRSTPTCS